MNGQRSDWRVWGLAGAASLAVLALVLLLFRSPVLPAPAAKPTGAASASTPGGTAPDNGLAAVGLERLGEAGSPLLREEANLRDPTPLYLPTRWNAGNNAVPAAARLDPGRSFPNYRPRLVFNEAELALSFPPAVAVPQRPAEAFAVDKPAAPFAGFGQLEGKIKPLAARGAFARIVRAGDGEEALAEALTDAKPPVDIPWEPLEFLVAVDVAGVVRPPVLTASSHLATVDQYFQDYLTRTLHVGERLRPGFYRVSIGP